MPHSLSLLAAPQATGSGPKTGETGDLPPDLTRLSLEQLMNLRVGGRARPDPDSQEASEARHGAAVLPGVADAPPAQGEAEDLPPDLTALSLGQLMNLRARALRPEEDEEDDDEAQRAQDGAQDEERDAEAAQAKDGRDADGGPGPGPSRGGGAAFSLSEAEIQAGVLAASLAEHSLLEIAFAGGLAGDPGQLGLGALVNFEDLDRGDRSAAAESPFGPGPGVAPGGGSGPAPGNQAPAVADDTALGAAEAPLTLLVLGNDSDPDGDPLSVTAVTQGADGSVVINADGSLTYTPEAGFTGSDSFAYTASDGKGGAGSASVTLYVGTASEGGPGADTLSGTPAPDVIFGHGGDDSLSGAPGDDLLYGGDGDDALSGASGNDILYGGAGDDTLGGASGDDVLYGGSGDDILDAASGADLLYGGAGDDVLVWNPSNAGLDGGSGTDTLSAAGADMDLTTFAGSATGLETIGLAGDASPNALTLSAPDVLDMSQTGSLTIDGDAGDSLDAGTGWTFTGSDGSGHAVYTQMVDGNLATLLVDLDIAVNAEITL